MTDFSSLAAYPTRFGVEEDKVLLRELAGLACGRDGRGMDCAGGLFSLATHRGPARREEFQPVEHLVEPDCVKIVLHHAAGLRAESLWTHDASSGVWSRKDSLRNDSSEAITILRCLSAFDFPPARYELHSQSSCWCRENQPRRQELSHGSLTLGCEFGRTTLGGTPYAVLRNLDTSRGLALHVVPRGNWIIRFTRNTMGDSLSLRVEAGLADRDLRLVLPPGESLELPELLLQPLGEAPAEYAAPALHSFLLRNHLPPDERDIPFVYNTWFDLFEILEVDRLRRQLAAAREIGCEVFVVDAGWYGGGNQTWSQCVGDWREATTRSFRGKMADFAEEVRAAGLGFGVWMEPERLGDNVPVLQQHPEWFFRSESGQFYPRLETPAVYRYTLEEMSRVVETYRLAWMKVDFNHFVGPDPTGAESSRYYEAWYRLLEELRDRFPRTFFEGCASGGLRTDIHTVRHFPLHFLSDTIEPVDMLRITQGALLRLTPGRLGKWVGLRSVGRTIPAYGQKEEEISIGVAAPGGALWTGARVWDPAFVAATALCGLPGLSGDLASLPPETRQVLRTFGEFYKTHRRFLVRCAAHLLTPPRPLEDRTGWAAIQLQPPGEEASLVLAYRLEDSRSERRFPLRNLSPDRTYRLVPWPLSEASPRECAGCELMESGLCVSLPQPWRAEGIFVQPV